MNRVHTVKEGEISEEVTSEDGSMEYWRLLPPIPKVKRFFFRKRYECVCDSQFTTHDKYELHYRKAVYEEENFVDTI